MEGNGREIYCVLSTLSIFFLGKKIIKHLLQSEKGESSVQMKLSETIQKDQLEMNPIGLGEPEHADS